MHQLHRNPGIRYICPEVSLPGLPLLAGSHQEARVPDTLDLAERARHAIHCLTATTDPEANAEIYWLACFGWKPPTMYHDANDWCDCKYLAPSLLLRLACGSDESLDVEQHRMLTLLQMQGPDGLCYIPLSGRPWGSDFGGEGAMYHTGTSGHFAFIGWQGRYIETAAVYHALRGDSRWLRLGEKLLSGLQRLVIDKGDYAYFHKTVYEPGDDPVETGVPPPIINHGYACLGHGLVTWYRMTGSEPALELALKLARFYAQGHSGFVGPDGGFRTWHAASTVDRPEDQPIHFHAGTLIRMLMLDAGLAADDQGLVQLAQRGYQYAKDRAECTLGYFPELLNNAALNGYGDTAEACGLSEMIYLALRQSVSGTADCWDDLDCWVRNMFAETQLLKTGWAYAFSDRHGIPRTHAHDVTTGVPERFRGGWLGWAWPNDGQGDRKGRSIMACCVGNSAMHLYRVWRDMFEYDPAARKLSIHLLLNRASPWADMGSHIPYRGQVDITVKQGIELAVRIPQWAMDTPCASTVNGKEIACRRQGRYLSFFANRGDIVTLRWPIAERVETLCAANRSFRAVIRGNEVVDLGPAGQYCPLFLRARYRQDETEWRTGERFVCENSVETY